jgi:amino-acid N-acetyltransferase
MPVDILVRKATADDARRIYRLIARHAREGRLLPRTLADVDAHVGRFLVATARGRLVGCAELAPLSPTVAEVRSLVVGGRHRGRGLGRRLVAELRRRARHQGFDELCAFVHDADYFGRLGFLAVPHARIPEKIEADCRQCPQFGRCGQSAMVTELRPLADSRSHSIALRAV